MELVLMGVDLRLAHESLYLSFIPVSLLLEWDKQLGLWTRQQQQTGQDKTRHGARAKRKGRDDERKREKQRKKEKGILGGGERQRQTHQS